MAFGLCQPKPGAGGYRRDTSRYGSLALLAQATAQPRVEDVSERVAQQVEAQNY